MILRKLKAKDASLMLEWMHDENVVRFLKAAFSEKTIEDCFTFVDSAQNAYVVTPNVDHIIQLERGGELAEAYKEADLIITDGKPLIWISKLYKTPIKEKISGSDLFPRLCDLAAKKGYRMFFLGAAEGVAEKAAANMEKRFPGLQVVGTYSPPIGFEENKTEMQRIRSMIKDAAPHVLIVALGCPKQELFILHNKDELCVPLSLGLGASLDFEAGNIKRAPKWMANCGLERLHRMIQDPQRLIKRYLIDDLKVFRLIFKYRNKGGAEKRKYLQK